MNDIPANPIAQGRLKKLEYCWALKFEGCSEKIFLMVVDIARPTFYRWQKACREYGFRGLTVQSSAPYNKRKPQPQWSKHLEQQVLHLRKRFPLWGKQTLTTILKRDHKKDVSESTVGRLLKKLIEQGKIKPVCFYYGAFKLKRHFNKHAKRWNKGMKAMYLSKLIQVHHMTINVGPGMCIKHFEATCPVTKMTVAQTYWNASSRVAATFLTYLKRQLPFALVSI